MVVYSADKDIRRSVNNTRLPSHSNVCLNLPSTPPFMYALTLSNINQFSKLFHGQI